MDPQISPLHKQLLQKIAEKEHFDNYTITIQTGSNKSDNYMGSIFVVEIVEKSGDKQLDLILKVAQDKDEFRKNAGIEGAYKREVCLYETIFNEFYKFQVQERIMSPFIATAKCYGTSLNEKAECLILENLSASGFRLWNRMRPMDEDHVILVISEFGKFHALSLALRDSNPRKFTKLASNILSNVYEEDKTPQQLSEDMKNHFDRVIKELKGNEEAVRGLEQFSKTAGFFLGCEMKERTKYDVVIHGDCWCNNILFNYEDEEHPAKPTALCFIDWQLSRIGSPVTDLTYFLCTSASKDILNDYEKYLKIYHASLSRMLRQFGSDPDEVFPYPELQNHWKKYCKYGLYMATMIVKIMLSESCEAPDFQMSSESGRSLIAALDFETSNNEKFKERICDVTAFMSDNNFL